MSQTTGDQVATGGGNNYGLGYVSPGGVSQGGNSNVFLPSLVSGYRDQSGMRVTNTTVNNNKSDQQYKITTGAGSTTNTNITSSDPLVAQEAMQALEQTNQDFMTVTGQLISNANTANATQEAAAFQSGQALVANTVTGGQGVISATGQSAAQEQAAANDVTSTAQTKKMVLILGVVMLVILPIVALLFRHKAK